MGHNTNESCSCSTSKHSCCCFKQLFTMTMTRYNSGNSSQLAYFTTMTQGGPYTSFTPTIWAPRPQFTQTRNLLKENCWKVMIRMVTQFTKRLLIMTKKDSSIGIRRTEKPKVSCELHNTLYFKKMLLTGKWHYHIDSLNKLFSINETQVSFTHAFCSILLIHKASVSLTSACYLLRPLHSLFSGTYTHLWCRDWGLGEGDAQRGGCCSFFHSASGNHQLNSISTLPENLCYLLTAHSCQVRVPNL